MAKTWAVPKKAEKVFTDREEPRKTFWEKYAYLQDHMDEHILLTFYGIGGIGKTSLIEQLCFELKQQQKKYATVDLESAESKGKTKILRTLATQLVQDKAFNMFRFLAGMRWYVYNTGAPDFIVKETDELLEDNRMLSGLSEWVSAADAAEVFSAFKEIIPIVPGIGPVIQFIKGVDQIRAGLIKKKFGEKVAHFLSSLQINENQPRKIEEELHVYFRDDLIESMANKKEPLVIFLDTYEVFTNIFHDHSVAIRNEQWLKELIPYIPGVLWVISGRDKLDWEDRYEAEQHLIGDLSEKDARSFLLGAGISEDMVGGIYELTQGVPIFLDLCVDRYQELISEGKTPTNSDFGENTEKLIERYLRHMPNHTKTLAYVLSCFKKWNQDMVETVIGNATKYRYDITEYNEFMKHSYIIKNADERYYMHDIMQDTIYNDKDFDLGLKNEINALLENYFITQYKNKENTDKAESLGGLVRVFAQNHTRIDEKTCDRFDLIVTMVEALYDLGQLHNQLIFSKELYDWANIIPDEGENKFLVHVKIRSFLLLAEAYLNNGIYMQAVNYAKRAADLASIKLGELHDDTLTALGYLGSCYTEAGEYKQANELLKQLYEKEEKQYGEEDIRTITVMSRLASSLSKLGRYQEALALNERVLELRRRLLSDNDLDTIAAMNNLANSLSNTGQYKEALIWEERVVELKKKILGEEHPDTIAAMGNVAITLNNLGRCQEALELQETVLNLQKQIYGEEHPYTISSLANLAIIMSDLDRQEEALALRETVLELRKRILGEEHPDTIAAMSDLAVSLKVLRRYEDALILEKRVLELRERILGEEHPDTIAAMSDLVVSLNTLGRYEESLTFGKRVLELRKQILGERHPDTIIAMNDIVHSLSFLGNYQDALSLQETVFELQKQILGEEHPDTISAMFNIARILHKFGRRNVDRRQKALVLCEHVLGLRKRILGEEHPDTILAMESMANLLSSFERYQEAMALDKRVLELKERMLGEKHLDTIWAMHSLALDLHRLNRDQEAQTLEERARKLGQQYEGEGHYSHHVIKRILN